MNTVFQRARLMIEAGHSCAIATVIQTSGSSPRPIGSQLLIRDDGYFEGSVSGGCVESAVISEALLVFQERRPKILHYGIQSANPFEVGIACGGEIDILLEPVGQGGISQTDLNHLADAEKKNGAINYQVNLLNFERNVNIFELSTGVNDQIFTLALRPPKRLFIVGAVHIAQYLIPMAQAAGFVVTLIDNRELFSNAERFANVDLRVEWPSDVLEGAALDRSSAVVTLTHDDKFDIPALATACRSDAFYIGALGSRKTQATRNNLLAQMGVDTRKIHGPVGLPIHAATPAEIAVSIMAELIYELHSHD